MPSDDLTYVPAWELAEAIRAKRISPIEVTEHFLDRIDQHNDRLNAFITVAEEQALERAAQAEAEVMEGKPLGPLHGVPIAIKDENITKGIRTTRGSLLFKDWVPDRDDITVERVRRSGAIIIGKTNTPEFGWSATTENFIIGPCRNPWNPERTSGGSSGGSAVAIAAGLAPISNGSDAGGSIRIPSSFCGVYGMKPTFGRVPGLYEGPGGWRPLTQNGPIAQSVRDAALMLSCLAGPDARDAMCLPGQPPDFMSAVREPTVKGLRIAWSQRLDDRPLDPEVRRVTTQAIRAFEQMGAIVEEASPVIDSPSLIHVLMTLLVTDMAAAMTPILDTYGHLLTPTLLEWVLEAQSAPATRYVSKLRELEWHKRRMAEFFNTYDLLLTPAMAVPAFPIGQRPDHIDGVEVESWWGFTPFLYPFNLTGQPAASVPCGFTADGLPVGLQIVGRKGDDLSVLRASAAFELAMPWQGRHPALDL